MSLEIVPQPSRCPPRQTELRLDQAIELLARRTAVVIENQHTLDEVAPCIWEQVSQSLDLELQVAAKRDPAIEKSSIQIKKNARNLMLDDPATFLASGIRGTGNCRLTSGISRGAHHPGAPSTACHVGPPLVHAPHR